MNENAVMERWDKGWIFVKKDELINALEILKKNGIRDAYVQFTPDGYFIRKNY